MTQEDKELLLKDLCARLPYGVKIHINSSIEEQNQMHLFDVSIEAETIGVGNEKWAFRAIPIIDDEDKTKVIKPYLRPMSSMTDEEKMFVNGLIYNKDCIWLSPLPTWVINESDVEKYIDFCHKRHLDWRGLIEKGLAIGTINGIYN